MVATDNGPIDGLNRTKLQTYAKLNCLNKICLTVKLEIEIFRQLNRLTFKLRAYAKLNYLKWNWNFTLELYLYLTDLFNIELFWRLTTCKQNLYLYLAEL